MGGILWVVTYPAEFSHFPGIGLQPLIFKAHTVSIAPENSLDQKVHSAKKDFIWLCLLFELMATEDICSPTKQT